MSIIDQLTSFVNRAKLSEIPQAACETGRNAILDCLGVTIAGAGEPASALVVEYVRGLGCNDGSTVIAKKMKTAPAEAALANATMAHALDFDDSSDTIGGHPSVVIVPAIMAVGERLHVSGEKVLEAYITGFELEAKLAKLVNFDHYDRGWHPTATLGVFGATAACAKLMQLEEEKTAMALGIAASSASGIKENFGTMTKPLQVGMASRDAVMAALLAERGFTASRTAMEGKQGFFEVYNGAGNYRLDDLEEMFGNPWDLERPGLAIKQYPCCGSTHSSVDAVVYLVNTFDVAPEEIDRMHVSIHPRRLAHTNRPKPQTSLEAKFSLQYATAVAAVNRGVSLEDFSDEAVGREAVQKMLGKIAVTPLAREKWGPEHFAAEVEITRHDGSAVRHRVEKAKGRGAELALSGDELEHKYLNCATQVFSLETARRCLAMIKQIEDLDDVAVLMNMLAAS